MVCALVGRDLNNTGFVVTGISFITLGIIGIILTENQFASGGSVTRSDDYHISQVVKVGATGMVTIGFGLAIISAAGITREKQATDS